MKRIIAVATRGMVVALAICLLLAPLPVMASQGEVVRVSVSSSGALANGATESSLVSGDGRFVIFTSKATNLVTGDTNGRDDVFRFDRVTGQVAAVSVTSTGVFLQATHSSARVSGDGRFIAFWSDGKFDGGDDDRSPDVILKDMLTGAVERVSIGSDGTKKEDADRVSPRATLAISDDGRFVAYNSSATNLVAGDVVDDQADLFLRDRGTSTTILLSTEPGGGPGASGGEEIVISGAGATAAAGFRVETPGGSGRLAIRMLDSGAETEVEGVGSTAIIDPGCGDGRRCGNHLQRKWRPGGLRPSHENAYRSAGERSLVAGDVGVLLVRSPLLRSRRVWSERHPGL